MTYKVIYFIFFRQALYSGTCGTQVVDVFTMANIEFGVGMFSLCFGLGLCALNPVAGKKSNNCNL